MPALRVLTWNLFHGRSVPDVPRDLLPAFAARVAAWEWDVALLQEVPPWWPPELARAAGATGFTAPTSRGQFLPLLRPLARRRADIVKSWGGGANAILVRGHGVTEHRRLRLTLKPERRVVHAVRRDDGLWVANLHATAHDETLSARDLRTAAAAVLRWAGDDAPVVFGGDMNHRAPVDVPGFEEVGGNVIDWVFARNLAGPFAAEVPHRHDPEIDANLSDHRPVLARIG